VAWDPVNRYLASQTGDGEDGMGEIKIWRTDDWTEVKRLQLPMAKMSGYINSTAISRLHWSPYVNKSQFFLARIFAFTFFQY
jgi:hypothetical protein